MVYSGIDYEDPGIISGRSVVPAPKITLLREGMSAWNPAFRDSLVPTQDQAHHFFGLFLFGYYMGAGSGGVFNYGRDHDNFGDIFLGTVAVVYGDNFYNGSVTPAQFAKAYLSPLAVQPMRR